MAALRDLECSWALLLPALLGCGAADDGDPAASQGRQLFSRYGCVTCHRADGRGGPMGPPLSRAGDHWTREDLAEFIAEPSRFVEGDARLRTVAAAYRAPMPGVTLDLEQRLLLADHVLGLRGDG